MDLEQLKELRLGNLINGYGSIGKTPQIGYNIGMVRVQSLSLDAKMAQEDYPTCLQVKTLRGDVLWHDPKDCSFILLNKILIGQLGFIEAIDNFYYIGNLGCDIFKYETFIKATKKTETGRETFTCKIGYCHYVHELQNIYYLITGKELIIKSEQLA